MAENLKARVEKIEGRHCMDSPRQWSVKFKADPGDGSKTPAPVSAFNRNLAGERTAKLWGVDSDVIYIKPGQSEADALRAAGIDPDKDRVLAWGYAA